MTIPKLIPIGVLVASWALASAAPPLAELVTPLPQLTPRPAAVAGVAAPVVSLNGTWQFAADGGGDFKPIEVPGEWVMQGFTVKAGEFARYRRVFEMPADWRGQAVKLRFDAVHAVCKIRVNGTAIGDHEGGFIPFEMDATAAIKVGNNELTVEVQSESVADSIACISQYAAHQVGGIIRKVTLFCVPPVHLTSQSYETVLDGATARLLVRSQVGGAVAAAHRLLDSAGSEVARGVMSAGTCELMVPVARLWTSETPALYTLETVVGTETIRERIGLREIKVAGNRLLINGTPVKLLGVNRHEVHPLRGRSLTPELCRKDAELFRAANVNLVRTSHYPPSEEFLTACDELGLFVECEAAVCWIKHGASPIWKTWNHLDPKYFPYLLRANLDNVAANRNHPSVILWSLANESLWTPLFAKVLEQVKQADSTRPATFHDQCWGGFNNGGSKGEIANYHYPTEANSAEWSKLDRPVWFGEYAHVECYNRRELVTDPGIRADWGGPLARMVDLIWQQPGCLGGAIWSGIDDVFHLPNGELKGYGHWGIIDGWRREKPEYQRVYQAYSPVKVLERKIEPGKPTVLKVANRFNFTNLREVEVALLAHHGKPVLESVPVPPGGTGEILVPEVAGPTEITFTDPRGVVVARETVGMPPPAEPAGLPSRLRMAGLEFDGSTLKLGDGAIPRLAPPVPMVLPLNGEGGAPTAAGTQLSKDIAPFTPVPAWLNPPRVEGLNGTLYIRGETADASVTIAISRKDIEIGNETRPLIYQVRWEATLKQPVNPRQWGLVFTLPRSFDLLSWECKESGDWFSAFDIMRRQGTAKANPGAAPAGPTNHPWAQDANALGTADFRSTKANIYRASLGDGKSTFTVRSPDAFQAVRAWVDGDCIRLLVAGFNTGGSDSFFAPHYAADRRPLKQGDVIRSSFEIFP